MNPAISFTAGLVVGSTLTLLLLCVLARHRARKRRAIPLPPACVVRERLPLRVVHDSDAALAWDDD